MPRNLFYNLLNCEDNHTDALLNILTIDEFNEYFTKILNIHSLQKIDTDIIQTRYNSKNYGKPDIYYTTDNVSFAFEVKIHTWTKLTEYQPEGYLNILNENPTKIKKFFLLIPVGYVFENDFKKRYNEWIVKTNYEIPLQIIYWQEIVHGVEKMNLNNFVINHFIEAMNLEYIKRSVFLEEYEQKWLSSPEVINFREKLKNIIEYARCELIKANYILEVDEDEELNYMVKDKKNRFLLWFGSWAPIWKGTGYALVVGCHLTHEKICNFSECEVYQDQKFYPITSQDLINEEPGKVLVNKIKEYLK